MLQRLLDLFVGRATGRSKSLDRPSYPPGAILGIADSRRPSPVERLRLGGPQPDYPRIPGSRRRERQAVANVRRMLAREARAGRASGADPMQRHAARFAAAVLGQAPAEPGRVDRITFGRLVDCEVRRLTGAAARERRL